MIMGINYVSQLMIWAGFIEIYMKMNYKKNIIILKTAVSPGVLSCVGTQG